MLIPSLEKIRLYRFKREDLSKHKVHKDHEGKKPVKLWLFPLFVYLVPFVFRLSRRIRKSQKIFPYALDAGGKLEPVFHTEYAHDGLSTLIIAEKDGI